MYWDADITKRRAAHVVTHLGGLLQHPDFAHKTLFISGRQPKGEQPPWGVEELVSRLGLKGVEILWRCEPKGPRFGYFLLEAHNPPVAHTIFQEASCEWEDNEGYFDDYHLQFGVLARNLKGEILNLFLKQGWCGFWDMLNHPPAQSDEFIYEIGGELGVSEITQEQATTERVYSGDKIPEEFKALIDPSDPDCARGAIHWRTTVSKRRACAIVSKIGDLLQNQEIPDKTLYVHGRAIGHHEYWLRETFRNTRGVEVLWLGWSKAPWRWLLPEKRLTFLLRLNSPVAASIIFQALQGNGFYFGYGVFDHQWESEVLDSFYKGGFFAVFHEKDKVNHWELKLHAAIANRPNHFVYTISGNPLGREIEEDVFCGEASPSALREAVKLWP